MDRFCRNCVHFRTCIYSTVTDFEVECKDFIHKDEWVSVEDDRKPKQLQECLCICRLDDEKTNEYDYYLVLKWHDFPYQDNGIVNKPHFTDEGVAGMRVVYWRPLPEHPER